MKHQRFNGTDTHPELTRLCHQHAGLIVYIVGTTLMKKPVSRQPLGQQPRFRLIRTHKKPNVPWATGNSSFLSHHYADKISTSILHLYDYNVRSLQYFSWTSSRPLHSPFIKNGKSIEEPALCCNINWQLKRETNSGMSACSKQCDANAT